MLAGLYNLVKLQTVSVCSRASNPSSTNHFRLMSSKHTYSSHSIKGANNSNSYFQYIHIHWNIDPIESLPIIYASESWVRKLSKPCALAMSATDRPSASKGSSREAAALAFSMSESSTAGSTRGTMPRRASVAGSEASLQRVGTS